MRTRTSGRKGLALVAVIVCICMLVVIVGALTVHLARLTLASSRYARSVRARALAEAGIEAAFAQMRSSTDGRLKKIRLDLDGGTCRVTLGRGTVEGADLRIVSVAELKLAGGHMHVTVTLDVKETDGGKSLRILSREERTTYVRADAPAETE